VKLDVLKEKIGNAGLEIKEYQDEFMPMSWCFFSCSIAACSSGCDLSCAEGCSNSCVKKCTLICSVSEASK